MTNRDRQLIPARWPDQSGLGVQGDAPEMRPHSYDETQPYGGYNFGTWDRNWRSLPAATAGELANLGATAAAFPVDLVAATLEAPAHIYPFARGVGAVLGSHDEPAEPVPVTWENLQRGVKSVGKKGLEAFLGGIESGYEEQHGVPYLGPALAGLGRATGSFRENVTGPLLGDAQILNDFLAPDPIPGPNVAAMKFYHGSPHRFSKFDIEKVGTGEGFQAFGQGLYAAERYGVGKSYRQQRPRKLSAEEQAQLEAWEAWNRGGGPDRYGIGDDFSRPDELQGWFETLDYTLEEDAHEFAGMTDAEMQDWAKNFIKDGIEDNLHDQMMMYGADSEDYADAARMAADDIAMLEDLRFQRAPLGADRGPEPPKPETMTDPADQTLYEVWVDADPEDFLKWDEPMSQQSPQVRERLGRVAEASPYGDPITGLGRDRPFSDEDVWGWMEDRVAPTGITWDDLTPRQKQTQRILYAKGVHGTNSPQHQWAINQDRGGREMTGEDAYSALARGQTGYGSTLSDAPDAAMASADLAQGGIPGHLFHDASSRGKSFDEPAYYLNTRNYNRRNTPHREQQLDVKYTDPLDRYVAGRLAENAAASGGIPEHLFEGTVDDLAYWIQDRLGEGVLPELDTLYERGVSIQQVRDSAMRVMDDVLRMHTPRPTSNAVIYDTPPGFMRIARIEGEPVRGQLLKDLHKPWRTEPPPILEDPDFAPTARNLGLGKIEPRRKTTPEGKFEGRSKARPEGKFEGVDPKQAPVGKFGQVPSLPQPKYRTGGGGGWAVASPDDPSVTLASIYSTDRGDFGVRARGTNKNGVPLQGAAGSLSEAHRMIERWHAGVGPYSGPSKTGRRTLRGLFQ